MSENDPTITAALELLAQEEAERKSSLLHEFVTGSAGTGKTTEIRRRMAEDPSYGILAATTGIAAVNLGEGVTTVHSLLRYKDTETLADAFVQGRLQARIAQLARLYRHLLIDEASMLGAEPLDMIFDAVELVNQYETVPKPFGLVLTGDFCQLPPIKEKYGFKAKCWPHFAENTTRLTKVWRQTDPNFLAALNFARAGEGAACADALSQTVVKWTRSTDMKFVGTTIMGTNAKVDNYNTLALRRIDSPEYTYQSRRWHCSHRHPSEWRSIPETLQVKKGAYVMILVNQIPSFEYANGDCGHIEECRPNSVTIRLARNQKVVEVPILHRTHTQKEDPSGLEQAGGAAYDDEKMQWLMGAVTYLPVRLAYAATVHKTQGLSLDRVQVDIREHFMQSSSMCYVALSRCRTPDGLHIVGTAAELAKKCNVAEEVREWL